MSTKIICVLNNLELFEKVVKNNENLKTCELFYEDNSKTNVTIPKFYNTFIDKNLLVDSENNDFWCVFIHQDFGIEENIDLILEKLNKNYIYGAVGIKIHRGLFIRRKCKNGHFCLKISKRTLWGEIRQGKNDSTFALEGKRVRSPKTVDALDCCCIIMHSSLIKKYTLRFDENLSFHMYAEELCYRAKKDYKIKSKVVQMECFHIGGGSLDEEFYKAVNYLKEKFHTRKIPSTCNT